MPGQRLAFVANLAGFLFSLWLIYHGVKTRSLWIVVGLIVASAAAFNLGFYERLGDYLERRKALAETAAKNTAGTDDRL